MSGDTDKLAQFQQNIDTSDGLVVVIGVGFAQKVLEIAKAAREVAYGTDNAERSAALGDLYNALSALDGDT